MVRLPHSTVIVCRWLYSNKLTCLPAEIGKMGQLRKLWLDSNLLTELPGELGDCSSLQVTAGALCVEHLPTQIGGPVRHLHPNRKNCLVVVGRWRFVCVGRWRFLCDSNGAFICHRACSENVRHDKSHAQGYSY
jgi:hypothetical protein